jgi:hypothetical protein
MLVVVLALFVLLPIRMRHHRLAAPQIRAGRAAG